MQFFAPFHIYFTIFREKFICSSQLIQKFQKLLIESEDHQQKVSHMYTSNPQQNGQIGSQIHRPNTTVQFSHNSWEENRNTQFRDQQNWHGSQGFGSTNNRSDGFSYGRGTGAFGKGAQWGQYTKWDKSQHKFSPYQDYVITTALGNKTLNLDISQDQNTKGKAILYNQHGLENQRFRLRPGVGPNANRYQIFPCLRDNTCLQVVDNSTVKGAQIMALESRNSPSEFWQIIPTDNEDEYYFKSFCGKCMDVCEGKNLANTPIIQYDQNEAPNQHWLVIPG